MARVAGEHFADNTACLTCVHVLEGEAVKLVSRDDEADWQFLCGQTVHQPFEARIISLGEAVALDARLVDLPPLMVGEVRSV